MKSIAADKKKGFGDIYVMSTKSYFKDDIKRKCDECGQYCFMRPHGLDIKAEKHLCLKCTAKEM